MRPRWHRAPWTGTFLESPVTTTPHPTAPHRTPPHRSGRLLVVRKEHIRAFAEPDDSIPPKSAEALLDLFHADAPWAETSVAGCTKPVYESRYPAARVEEGAAIRAALESVKTAKPFPPANVPGSVVRQAEIVRQLEEEMEASPVSAAGEGEAVLMALR